MNRLGRLQLLSEKVRSLGGAPAGPATSANAGWMMRRGETRASLDCDVIGNFPASRRSAALIVGARTEITSTFLIVDEGEPHGFALSMPSILDVSLDDAPHAGPDLIVRYRHEGDSGWFRLRESRGKFRRKSVRGIEALRSAFRAGHVSFGEVAASFNSFLLVPWDAAAGIESDRVVWSGHATAPIRATLECAPTDLWVTATALIWGGVKGEGINRLPLTAIRSLEPITLADRETTPAVYVFTFGPENFPVSLPFIFDAAQNVGPERDAFLELFSPSLVTQPAAERPLQPWANLDSDLQPDDRDAPENDLFDEMAADPDEELDQVAGSVEPESAIEEEELPSWETWSAAKPPSRFGAEARSAGALSGYGEAPMSFDSSGMRLTEALSVWPTGIEPEPEPEEPDVLEPVAIPAYLTAARNAITEVNEIIDRRMAGNSSPSPRLTPPSTEQQATALAELVELVGSGYYGAEASRAVKTRITRYGEAAVRIRSLLELCNAGHMTIAEAGTKRDQIMAGLPVETDD